MTNASATTQGFVAINYIECTPEYVPRFEQLFSTRAHAIDKLPGFRNMYVLKPTAQQEKYLIVSHWDSEDNFKAWTRSEAFLEGHKRGFEDVRKAKESGLPAPMHSDFKTYNILTN